MEGPLSAESLVRSTGLCSVTVVLVTHIKVYVTSSSRKQRRRPNNGGPPESSASPCIVHT